MSLMLEEKVKAPWKWVSKFTATQTYDVPVTEEASGVLSIPDTVAFPTAQFFEVTSEKPTLDWEMFSAYQATWTPPSLMAVEAMETVRTPAEVTEVTTKPEDWLTRFKVAALAVIEEAGIYHICQPRMVAGNGMPGFRYTYQGEADCIVGRILNKMGVSVSVLAAYEGMSADYMVKQTLGIEDAETLRQVQTLAVHVQNVNDLRHPWGQARTFLM